MRLLLLIMIAISTATSTSAAHNSPAGQFHHKTEILRQYASEKFVVTDARANKMKTLAESVLSLAEQFNTNWDYGNAIHHGHLVLGRVSLHMGNTDEAKRHLKAAAQVKGSPQLDSFGPNMSLAKELLKKGEKDAVLDYFNDCEKFWSDEFAKKDLSEWRSDIAKGKIPKFRGNLVY
jgi:hypothetical protein